MSHFDFVRLSEPISHHLKIIFFSSSQCISIYPLFQCRYLGDTEKCKASLDTNLLRAFSLNHGLKTKKQKFIATQEYMSLIHKNHSFMHLISPKRFIKMKSKKSSNTRSTDMPCVNIPFQLKIATCTNFIILSLSAYLHKQFIYNWVIYRWNLLNNINVENMPPRSVHMYTLLCSLLNLES